MQIDLQPASARAAGQFVVGPDWTGFENALTCSAVAQVLDLGRPVRSFSKAIFQTGGSKLDVWNEVDIGQKCTEM